MSDEIKTSDPVVPDNAVEGPPSNEQPSDDGASDAEYQAYLVKRENERKEREAEAAYLVEHPTEHVVVPTENPNPFDKGGLG